MSFELIIALHHSNLQAVAISAVYCLPCPGAKRRLYCTLLEVHVYVRFVRLVYS